MHLAIAVLLPLECIPPLEPSRFEDFSAAFPALGGECSPPFKLSGAALLLVPLDGFELGFLPFCFEFSGLLVDSNDGFTEGCTLFAVLGGSIMLEMSVPVLAALVAVPGKIDQQAAMAFFLIGAVHVALMLLALKVASTMVAGWQVFGLAPGKERERPADPPRPVPVAQPVAAAARNTNVAPLASVATSRRVDVAPPPQVVVANDTGAESGAVRDTRVIAHWNREFENE